MKLATSMAGGVALAWSVAFQAGDRFNQHHLILVAALIVAWCGWVGFVCRKKGVRR